MFYIQSKHISDIIFTRTSSDVEVHVWLVDKTTQFRSGAWRPFSKVDDPVMCLAMPFNFVLGHHYASPEDPRVGLPIGSKVDEYSVAIHSSVLNLCPTSLLQVSRGRIR